MQDVDLLLNQDMVKSIIQVLLHMLQPCFYNFGLERSNRLLGQSGFFTEKLL